VEFAFTLKLMMVMIFAIMWASRAYNTYETMARAAREAARYSAAPTCALCGNAFPSDTQVVGVLSNYMQASALRPAAISSYQPSYGACNGVSPACTTTSNVTVCRGVPVSNAGTQQCGTAVSFAYPMPLSMNMGAGTSAIIHLPVLTIRTQAQMVPEQ
jgi:Flp pilus assembly protein TadG